MSYAKWVVLVLVFVVWPHDSLTVYGEGSVYESYTNKEETRDSSGEKEPSDSLNTVAKQNDSIVPYFVKFILSFLAIIVLLIFFLRYLKSKSNHLQSQGPFHSIGGFSLGGSRSLQMIMIGRTIYIVGVGNEIQLLRTIEPGEEQDLILQSYIEEAESKPFGSNPKQNFEKWEQSLFSAIDRVKQSSFSIKKGKD